MTIIFYIFITALLSSLMIVPTLQKWAVDLGLLDVPGDRKIHTVAMPRLGGIAIFTAALFSLLLFVEFSRPILGILAGAVIVFISGVIDDLYGLSPKNKFTGQILACLVTMFTGNLYLTNLGNLLGQGDIILSPWLAVPFTLFAVVGMVNAVNMMDGLDGLAGGIAIISLGAFLFLALNEGNIHCIALCSALLGSVLGFLKYNTHPAIIFMGDAGSLTLGFFLGFIAILLTQSPHASISPMMPVIILGLPIIDTLWVMSKRIFYGKNPFTPDRTHVHHLFLDLGFNHRSTVGIIYGISLLEAVSAFFFHKVTDSVLFFTYVAISVLFYFSLKLLIVNKNKFYILKKFASQSLRT